LKTPVNLEVSKASKSAIQAVEASGGTVTCSYFNALALRALVKPYKFELLPMRARPPPKVMQWYLNKDNCGYLSPEIQKRNLKLFGFITSEQSYRKEHEYMMLVKRSKWDIEREERKKEVEEKLSKRRDKVIAKHQRSLKRNAEQQKLQSASA
jgi:hypothetical protein